jgi:hypothetical protein
VQIGDLIAKGIPLFTMANSYLLVIWIPVGLQEIVEP